MSFRNVLQKMRRYVQEGRCKPRFHSYIEMQKDGLYFEDAMCAILTGVIRKRQWDRQYNEWKYAVTGRAEDGSDIELWAKIESTDEEEIVRIITVYRL